MDLDINKRIMSNYEDLKVQLERLRTDLDAEKIIFAKTKEEGDLSENAGFVTSKDKISRLNKSISDIQNRIKMFEEYSLENPNLDNITIGSVFKIETIETIATENEVFTFKLVPAALGKAVTGALSVESQVGKACEGRAQGETFKVKSPAKTRLFKIIEIIKEDTK